MRNRFSEEIEAGEEKAVVMVERKRLFTELNNEVGDEVAVYRVGENHPVVDIERKFKRLNEDLGVKHAFSRELKFIETAEALGKQFKTDKAGMVSEDMVSLSIDIIKKKISEIIGRGSVQRFLFADSIVPREIKSSIRSRIVSDLTEMFEKFPGAVNKMDLKTAQSVAYSYDKYFREYADMLMPKVCDQFLKVKGKLLEKADTKLLPISKERIEETLGDVVITVSDVFSRYFKRPIGIYNSSLAEISVQLDAGEEFMERILMHESLHALSGKTFLVDGKRRRGDIDRLGFRYDIAGSKYDSKPVRLNWMNEGYTETLCEELMGKVLHDYLAERALVKKLFEGMPDKGILNRAYFEDYDETKIATGQVMDHWKQVRAYLTKRFGQHFLIDLDNYIHYQAMKKGNLLKGAEIAAREWDKMGDKFPAYVSSFVRLAGNYSGKKVEET